MHTNSMNYVSSLPSMLVDVKRHPSYPFCHGVINPTSGTL